MIYEELFREDEEAWSKGEASFPDRKMQRVPPYFWREAGPFDWTDCPDVEVVVGRLGGVPTLCDSRFSADNLLALYEDGMSVDEILEDYELDPGRVRRILDFARTKGQGLQAT